MSETFGTRETLILTDILTACMDSSEIFGTWETDTGLDGTLGTRETRSQDAVERSASKGIRRWRPKMTFNKVNYEL